MSIEINISNYESYFLSYIDNELSDAERAALLVFLENHPQFRQELELLEGTRLVPDTDIVFDNKAALYRSGQEELDYEALMLSYIDGELSGAEKKELEEHLQQQPAARKELALLQAVKLSPDTSLVFPDKTTLYRTSQRKPVFIYKRIGWAAAAAAVAGIIFWLSVGGDHTSKNAPVVASHTPAVTSPVTPALPEQKQTSSSPEVATAPAEKPVILADATVSKAPKINKPVLANTAKSLAKSHLKKEEADVAMASAAAPRQDAPIVTSLPVQRNAVDEVVEQHLQQAANAQVAAVRPEVNREKETVLAASVSTAANAASTNKVVPASEPQSVHGELIMSVSGSDSKILDKVTNVAKFFSRRRNKS
ncbi:zf-HC2 domain-containing protein [Chitinophaga sp. 212800010-3]|uniref:anti-sigma factor family protein n=1 Tax=unclassified Chitinophaga TaxID=2619133 RepID=UPI002DE7DDFC|nr:Zf-HC2 domain-containing protein [Chitinophaga sp. 212800010-3]